jgi:hypothetical protein
MESAYAALIVGLSIHLLASNDRFLSLTTRNWKSLAEYTPLIFYCSTTTIDNTER